MEAHIGDRRRKTKRKAKIRNTGSGREMRKMREMKRDGSKKLTYLHTHPLYAWHHEL